MGEQGRYVPTQILYLAFRYGKKNLIREGWLGFFVMKFLLKQLPQKRERYVIGSWKLSSETRT